MVMEGDDPLRREKNLEVTIWTDTKLMNPLQWIIKSRSQRREAFSARVAMERTVVLLSTRAFVSAGRARESKEKVLRIWAAAQRS